MKDVKKILKKRHFRQVIIYLLINCLVFGVPMRAIQAAPSNPHVVAGAAGLGQTGNTTTVTMGSNRAVINWNSLNTSSNEVLQFLKDSGNFAVLNRVIGGGPTQFDGSLFADNGSVFIVNTQGLVFGPAAYIRASQFVGSGLDITNTRTL